MKGQQEDSMRVYVDNVPKNCNKCVFKQIMSQHWDLEDYCLLNRKITSRIIIKKDCPLVESDTEKVSEDNENRL